MLATAIREKKRGKRIVVFHTKERGSKAVALFGGIEVLLKLATFACDGAQEQWDGQAACRSAMKSVCSSIRSILGSQICLT